MGPSNSSRRSEDRGKNYQSSFLSLWNFACLPTVNYFICLIPKNYAGIDVPNNVNAVALFMASSAVGSLKAYKTTPLLTIDESIEAMKTASKADIQPPK